MAAIALDQLPLSGDLVGLRVDVLGLAGVAFLALPVIRGVVATEDRELPVAQLPDAIDRRVEECTIMRRDDEGARASPKVLLQPLERVEIQVIGRLVQQQEIGIRDHEAGERAARLLPSGHLGGRTGPFVAGEAQPRQRFVHALVEGVSAKHIEAVLELLVGCLGHPMRVLHFGELALHRFQRRRPATHGCPEVRGCHERRVEMRLLGEHPE